MEFPNEIGPLTKALLVYLIAKGSGLPDFAQENLAVAASAPSPVDRIVKSAEALYAIRDDLDADGQTVCAQLASFAAQNGWHGLEQDNRGGKMAQAMLRDMGEKAPVGKWPAKDKDPAAAEEFVEPVATPEIEAAAVEAPADEPK